MADSQRANRMAREDGFVRAEYLTDWNGYGVYEPIVADDGEIHFVGRVLILQNDEECRWAEPDEVERYMAEVDESKIEGY